MLSASQRPAQVTSAQHYFEANGFVAPPGYNPELTGIRIFDLNGQTSDFFEIASFQLTNDPRIDQIFFTFITTSPTQVGPLTNGAVIGSILETPGWHDLSGFFPHLPAIYFRGSVPEPSTLPLIGLAIIGIVFWRRTLGSSPRM